MPQRVYMTRLICKGSEATSRKPLDSVVVKTIFPAVLCLVPNLTYLVSRGQIRRNFDNIDWIKFLLFELKSFEMSYTESKDRGYVNAVV